VFSKQPGQTGSDLRNGVNFNLRMVSPTIPLLVCRPCHFVIRPFPRSDGSEDFLLKNHAVSLTQSEWAPPNPPTSHQWTVLWLFWLVGICPPFEKSLLPVSLLTPFWFRRRHEPRKSLALLPFVFNLDFFVPPSAPARPSKVPCRQIRRF